MVEWEREFGTLMVKWVREVGMQGMKWEWEVGVQAKWQRRFDTHTQMVRGCALVEQVNGTHSYFQGTTCKSLWCPNCVVG